MRPGQPAYAGCPNKVCTWCDDEKLANAQKHTMGRRNINKRGISNSMESSAFWERHLLDGHLLTVYI